MVEEEVQKLKEEVMSMFIIVQNPSQKLSLIDSIQRLGLSYHFEKEISEILHHMQKPSVVDNDENIYEAALRFRLLRQQGYAIPTGMFLPTILKYILKCKYYCTLHPEKSFELLKKST